MNEIEEIERMEAELNQRKNALRQKQETCNHKWSEVKYDPEQYREPIFSHYERCGSDPYPVYNYITKDRDRWSRTCKICGKTEYTYEKKATKYEPSFD